MHLANFALSLDPWFKILKTRTSQQQTLKRYIILQITRAWRKEQNLYVAIDT